MSRGTTAPVAGSAVLYDATRRRWLGLAGPVLVVEAFTTTEVLPALRRVEELVRRHGLCAAGWIAYEAAPGLDPKLTTHPAGDLPLLWFGVYDRAEDVAEPGSDAEPARLDWRPSVDRAGYDSAIAAIKGYIAAGDTYQVNHTIRLRAAFDGDPRALFRALVRAQRCDYAACIDTGRWVVCSASPELFQSVEGDRVVSRPMKGTARRGLWSEDDEARADWLRASVKNRAENLMIVDMVRNDLGRIARVGTVEVPRMYDVERYPTVWQMTSTVAARTDAGVAELLTATFPCASITGAPKRRTMEIIRELEPEPRGVYTGALGMILPGGRAQFSVAIRTVVVDRERQVAEYGVGGGIVWDSGADDEYEECLTKARVLTESRPQFSLLETLLWQPGPGWFLLDHHLTRMRDSARYFGFTWREDDVRASLEAAVANASHAAVVRLTVGEDGLPQAEVRPVPVDGPGPVRLALASAPVDPSDPFLYHKTTHRVVYEAARAADPDADDVLLWSPDGYATETTICNIVARIGGALVTPPVECGLLPGTFRRWLLETGQITERPITLDELRACERLFVVNSVRRWREAVLLQG